MGDYSGRMKKIAEIDQTKKRVYLRFEGYMNMDQARELQEAYRSAIKEVGSGYTVLSYFKDYKPVGPEIQEVISEMIQMASDGGCRKAARVGGSSVLGPLQLNRLSQTKASYPHDQFETWEDAEAYLDIDD